MGMPSLSPLSSIGNDVIGFNVFLRKKRKILSLPHYLSVKY